MVLQDSTVSSELTFVTTSALQCLPTVQVQLQVQAKAKAKVQVQVDASDAPVPRGQAGASFSWNVEGIVGEALVLLNTQLATLVLTLDIRSVGVVAVQHGAGGLPDHLPGHPPHLTPQQASSFPHSSHSPWHSSLLGHSP